MDFRINFSMSAKIYCWDFYKNCIEYAGHFYEILFSWFPLGLSMGSLISFSIFKMVDIKSLSSKSNDFPQGQFLLIAFFPPVNEPYFLVS